jgi:hypothetical protein
MSRLEKIDAQADRARREGYEQESPHSVAEGRKRTTFGGCGGSAGRRRGTMMDGGERVLGRVRRSFPSAEGRSPSVALAY